MADITRKGFLGAVAAAIAAPAVAGTKVARHRDVITQKELHAIVAAHQAVWDGMWKLRNRIEAGAEVQHGDLALEAGRNRRGYAKEPQAYGYGQMDCEIEIWRAEDLKRLCSKFRSKGEHDVAEHILGEVVGGAAALNG